MLVEIAAVLVSGLQLVAIVDAIKTVPTPVVFCEMALVLAKRVAVDVACETVQVEIAAVLVSGVRLVVIVHRVDVVPIRVVFNEVPLVLRGAAVDVP